MGASSETPKTGFLTTRFNFQRPEIWNHELQSMNRRKGAYLGVSLRFRKHSSWKNQQMTPHTEDQEVSMRYDLQKMDSEDLDRFIVAYETTGSLIARLSRSFHVSVNSL